MEKDYTKWLQDISEKIIEKMDWVSLKNADKIPYTTDENGNYDDRASMEIELESTNGINWWTNGFWGGTMWLLYKKTGDEKYRRIAEKSEEKLKKCLVDFYGIHHDVGFMFMPTAVANYRITGNQESRRSALHAANILAGRFNPVGEFIRAWNDHQSEDTSGWAIIDCMCNLSLLYWAAEETKDLRFMHVARKHADTVMKHFIRPDGSVIHIGEFNPMTGAFVKSHRGQGYAEGSAWSRGQAWAVYGFTNSFVHTGNEEYLEAAKRVAHYCMANISDDGIVPVDFRQPKEPAWEDSCGACILASGLIDVAKYVKETEREMYLRTAKNILRNISNKRADWSKQCDAIVQNCSAAYHDVKHHFTMCYADYYFIEAIFKLQGKEWFMW